MKRQRASGRAVALALAAFAALVLVLPLHAQEIEFHAPASARDEHAMAAMRDLAQRVLPVYQENHPERYLGNLSALQLVAGDFAAAESTRQSLAKRLQGLDPAQVPRAAALYDIYVRARAAEARDRLGFDLAFTRTYREVLTHLSDLEAYAVTGLPPEPLGPLESALDSALERQRPRGSIALPDAVDLVWMYFAFDAHRRFGALLGVLAAEDDRRRYISDERISIRTADGARLEAALVRPRAAAQPRPALLELTSGGTARNFARECAAHGYVGVVAYTRGHSAAGPGAAAAPPFEHEGADALAVIDWIAHQAWSDGRVGMYGEGYSAYAMWAAARLGPPALKAVAGSDTMVPGVDFPMVGNVFQNAAYRWLLETTRPAVAGRDGQDARWQALDRVWYENGDPSGDLDGLFGQPSSVLHRWLEHPGYDGYWQAMNPSREQWQRITIPALSISGYYAPGQAGTLYYFREQLRANPRADHTLLLGPYEQGETQGDGRPALAADEAAIVALRELRYRWFDFVLRGGPKPALLQDRVNIELAGADLWWHAPDIPVAGMGPIKPASDAGRGADAGADYQGLRFYLDPARNGGSHLLAPEKAATDAFVRETVDLAERRDAARMIAANRPRTGPSARNGIIYATEPLAQPLDLGGLFAGHLELQTNKRDLDFTLALYEQLGSGEIVTLFDPPLELRASYLADGVHRHLLRPGEREQLAFTSTRVVGRRLQAGSRLVMVLGVNKRPDQEINLGTGRDVRSEYIEFAGPPLEVRWFGNSYIDLPVQPPAPSGGNH